MYICIHTLHFNWVHTKFVLGIFCTCTNHSHDWPFGEWFFMMLSKRLTNNKQVINHSIFSESIPCINQLFSSYFSTKILFVFSWKIVYILFQICSKENTIYINAYKRKISSHIFSFRVPLYKMRFNDVLPSILRKLNIHAYNSVFESSSIS